MITANNVLNTVLFTRVLNTVGPGPVEGRSTAGFDNAIFRQAQHNGIPARTAGLIMLTLTLLISAKGTAGESLNLPLHAQHNHPGTQDGSPGTEAAKTRDATAANTRDPHAYSDGYDFGPSGKPHKEEDSQGSVIVDRLESFTSRGSTSMTYDWQAWYGGSYDKALVRSEGEIESGRFFNARNELLWAHAITPFWDTQAGIRYDSGQGAERGWLAFGIQGLMPYWIYTEATAYLNEQGRTAFRLEFEYDWLLTQKLILQPRIEMNFYSRDDVTRGIKSGLSDVEAGLRLRYEIIREFAPYVGVEWASANSPYTQNLKQNGVDELRFVAGIHFWL